MKNCDPPCDVRETLNRQYVHASNHPHTCALNVYKPICKQLVVLSMCARRELLCGDEVPSMHALFISTRRRNEGKQSAIGQIRRLRAIVLDSFISRLPL